jgi:uncharacterized protein YggE
MPFQPKYMERAAMNVQADAAEQSYAPGDMRFVANVNAQYEIAR